MINENVAFEKRARVLHIVLTAPPPRGWFVLLTHLVELSFPLYLSLTQRLYNSFA